MPSALVEHSGFRNFMVQLAPKWKPTSARHMKTNLLPSLSSSIRTRIELLLADVDYLTITVDVWTNRSGKAFLGITGHFIVLQEAIDILEPFTEITLRIQSESVVTISLVVPSIVHLLDHLNAMKSSVTHLNKLISQLEPAINKRFAGIVSYLLQQPVSDDEPYSDPIYFVTSVLNPRFKLYWLQQMKYNPAVEPRMKQLLIQTVLKECEQTKHIHSDTLQSRTQCSSSSSRTSNSSVSQSDSGPAIKRRKLFHYDNGSDPSFDSKLSPVDELNAFLTDPVRSKIPLYWKSSSFSSLKSVVRRVFSVQASSAPVERAFSQAGLILSPKRTSMLTELFQTLVFLRVYQKLL